MTEYISAYLKAHEHAWAESTLKSERSRLTQLAPLLHLSPQELFAELTKTKKPYTIKTSFIRIINLEKWAKLTPQYAEWMKTHERRFRRVYEPEQIKVTHEEALARIMGLKGSVRLHAQGLLQSGVRLTESYNVKAGRVVGKGGKARKVYGKIEETVSKTTLARSLKKIGLKPHTLRKLCASRLAENGATAADLCKVFGWSSIETSYYYLQAKDEAKLESLMASSQKES